MKERSDPPQAAPSRVRGGPESLLAAPSALDDERLVVLPVQALRDLVDGQPDQGGDLVGRHGSDFADRQPQVAGHVRQMRANGFEPFAQADADKRAPRLSS